MQVDKILQILPESIGKPIKKLCEKGNDGIKELEEIRIRTNRPVLVKRQTFCFICIKMVAYKN